MPGFFLTRDRKNVDADGRGGEKEFGWVGEGETIIRIYNMRNTKKSISNKVKRKK